ncbi:DNA repair protein complementing XP-A cells homolog isoform X2 [Plodia interpunctella]|nr:DNA repair protein complementing XP-A cells homolog isoform X2 [Plodia interpunctella]XP_053611608.1 DNA repair protein complementing XP-A cells homolog isoform X2 [Plodia interpunctella]
MMESVVAETAGGVELTAAQRARMERNRLRARALHDARLIKRPDKTQGSVVERVSSAAPMDSGGGFLLEPEEVTAAPAPAPRDAPLVHIADQPQCMDCERRFPQSFLFDTFDYELCDDCRDDEGSHSLITRTEAKTEFLLKDCDLDSRPPPLRCLRRRNPHAPRGDMRLYLRPQVEARALQVWGSEQRLQRERQARAEARARGRELQTTRRLRALRMDVRGSLYVRARAAHEHAFGPESYDADADEYKRTCSTCGFVQTYEKL